MVSRSNIYNTKCSGFTTNVYQYSIGFDYLKVKNNYENELVIYEKNLLAGDVNDDNSNKINDVMLLLKTIYEG